MINNKHHTKRSSPSQIISNESSNTSLSLALIASEKQSQLRDQQDKILQDVEAQNIVKNIRELIDEFNPPSCKKCSNRFADRICISKACGNNDFLELICGKCHLNTHSELSEITDIDISSFFEQLGLFASSTQLDEDFLEKGIDIEKMSKALQEIEDYEKELNAIEERILNYLAVTPTFEQKQDKIQTRLSSILSNMTFENIHKQFHEINKEVNFLNNEFHWNDVKQELNSLTLDIDQMQDNQYAKVKKSVLSSFKGERNINLDSIQVKKAEVRDGYNHKPPTIRQDGGVISVTTDNNMFLQQSYLDFRLDPTKKYTIRFTVNKFFQNYFFVGLMKDTQVNSFHLFSGSTANLFKRFHSNCPSEDCSKVMRGKNFVESVKSGNQYEMRVCIEEQTLEFMTYPDYSNVVSKLDGVEFDVNSNYVITLDSFSSLVFSIDSFLESYFFPPY